MNINVDYKVLIIFEIFIKTPDKKISIMGLTKYVTKYINLVVISTTGNYKNMLCTFKKNSKI